MCSVCSVGLFGMVGVVGTVGLVGGGGIVGIVGHVGHAWLVGLIGHGLVGLVRLVGLSGLSGVLGLLGLLGVLDLLGLLGVWACSPSVQCGAIMRVGFGGPDRRALHGGSVQRAWYLAWWLAGWPRWLLHHTQVRRALQPRTRWRGSFHRWPALNIRRRSVWPLRVWVQTGST